MYSMLAPSAKEVTNILLSLQSPRLSASQGSRKAFQRRSVFDFGGTTFDLLGYTRKVAFNFRPDYIRDYYRWVYTG